MPSHDIESVVFTSEGVRSTKEERIRALRHDALPASFRTNSRKEELCMEYVEDFRRKFVDLFPDRRPLLLCPPNECGVAKFICTTVRPTQLPYRELNDVHECALLVANFMDYEPLTDPLEPPEVIPSPYSVLQWRVGDCFDFGMLLTSYLLGVGYDAYCVMGYAPKWVCMRDRSYIECPMLVEEREAQLAAKRRGESKGEEGEGEGGGKREGQERYAVRPRGVQSSAFMHDQERKRAEEEAARRQREECDSEEEEEADEDPLQGRRVHCWVLVRAGKRDVTDSFFLEPSTGTRYPVGSSPYLGVEALWNHQNYWVNMQDPSHGVRAISFDLKNTDHWEFVFLTAGEAPTREARAESAGSDQLDALEADLVGEAEAAAVASEPEFGLTDGTHVLDLPPTWVPKLAIPRTEFNRRVVGASGIQGQNVVLYRKAKHEIFARHMHERVRRPLRRTPRHTSPQLTLRCVARPGDGVAPDRVPQPPPHTAGGGAGVVREPVRPPGSACAVPAAEQSARVFPSWCVRRCHRRCCLRTCPSLLGCPLASQAGLMG